MRTADVSAPTRRNRLVVKRQLPSAIVAVVGVALSLLTCWHLWGLEALSIRDQFAVSSQRRVAAITGELTGTVSVIDALRMLFDASNEVSRGEFAMGVAHLIDRHDYIQMLAWAPRVSAADRARYETRAREDGMERFQITERDHPDGVTRAQPRAEYYPVYFAEPYIGNETDIGYDLASNPTTAADLALACDLNRLVVATHTPRMLSVTDEPGFVVFMPVYDQRALLYSVAERRRNLRGFIVGECRFEELVGAAFALLDRRAIAIQISDRTDPGLTIAHYEHLPVPGQAGPSAPVAAERAARSTLHSGQTLEFGERRWLVSCTAMPEFTRDLATPAPWWALIGGLLATALLATWVAALSGQAARVRALVDQRTLDLRASETQLRTAADAAHAATRAKSEFLANMSHEIRTPMTAILGYADVLLERGNIENAPSEHIDAIETIKRNGEYLLGIINDILDLSKIEAGRLCVEHIACNPCALVADMASLVKVKADRQGLSFEIEYTGPVPETILTDPTRLRQILINLVGNAIKFTEFGGVRLITRFINDSKNPRIEFDILDTGIGMTEAEMDKLFQPFTQADASTARKFGGTGLGLTISKRFAEMLGGDLVVVDTRPGVGTRFRVSVTTGDIDGVKLIDDPLTATMITAEASVEMLRVTESALDGVRILLAEDGPDNQRLISHVLRKAGGQVMVAENGRRAADVALAANEINEPFDVILMDMQMPVLDGYQATSLLREKGYTGTIVALTAHAMSGDRDKCLDAGCDDYAVKPINRKQLIETIRQHCQSVATPS